MQGTTNLRSQFDIFLFLLIIYFFICLFIYLFIYLVIPSFIIFIYISLLWTFSSSNLFLWLLILSHFAFSDLFILLYLFFITFFSYNSHLHKPRFHKPLMSWSCHHGIFIFLLVSLYESVICSQTCRSLSPNPLLFSAPVFQDM